MAGNHICLGCGELTKPRARRILDTEAASPVACLIKKVYQEHSSDHATAILSYVDQSHICIPCFGKFN